MFFLGFGKNKDERDIKKRIDSLGVSNLDQTNQAAAPGGCHSHSMSLIETEVTLLLDFLFWSLFIHILKNC